MSNKKTTEWQDKAKEFREMNRELIYQMRRKAILLQRKIEKLKFQDQVVVCLTEALMRTYNLGLNQGEKNILKGILPEGED